MAGLKAPVKDEWLDAVLCRPIGRQIARFLGKHTSLSANQVTFFTGMVGVSAGICYAFPWPAPLYGAALFFSAMVFDCVDGELSRFRNSGGWQGRIIDGLADGATVFSIFLGMVIYLGRLKLRVLGVELGFWHWFVLFIPAAATFVWHSAVVDDVKQRLKQGSIDKSLDKFADDPKTPFEKMIYRSWVNYVAWLERSTGPGRPGGYLCFRRVQWFGPTHHHLLMVIAALFIAVFPAAYVGYWFIAIVPANLYMVSMLYCSRSSCRMQSTKSA
ncbi:MAG: CDP-alcohol phosphatidyltransferase family protein [Myxococcales bacterium]|nr:MAG: CDP-alcohol phosphatidyltransferase family protein [Myxococcales bacterium]